MTKIESLLTRTEMPLEPFAVEAVPLRPDGKSGYLVGKTRVPLDTIVNAYLDGATPEDIVRRYDTLAIADVYAVLAYYWRNQERVHAYLAARRREAAAIRTETERRFPDNGAGDRLRAFKQD